MSSSKRRGQVVQAGKEDSREQAVSDRYIKQTEHLATNRTNEVRAMLIGAPKPRYRRARHRLAASNELETRQTMNDATGPRPVPPQDYQRPANGLAC